MLHDEQIDEELYKQLVDRFEGYELCEYLNIAVEDILEAFPDKIKDAQDDLEEFLSIGR